jgi:hypothetical protein
MRIAKYVLVIVFGALLCTGSWAQSVENSRVTGLVTDPSGATVAGAQVQMTQTGTGLVRTVETNGDGTYTIPDLPSGAYQLQVKKEGFNTYVQSGIVLQVGSNPTLDVGLQVGSTTQAVTVTANAAIVETHSSSIGEVVNHQEILDIPLNARDPMQLLTLTPSAVVAGGYNTALDFPNPYTIAFAGTSPGVGTYILDGGNDNDAHTSDSYPLPFPDALQEFSAVLTAVPAQYGMHSSATVNAITKSGSNEFHGDAFEFVRNGDFNAKSFYAPRRDPLKRNQFGGVLGGPIRKDKLFFFGAIQDTIVRDVSNGNVAFLPTEQELAGDFKTATSTQCLAKAVTLKAPFVNNMISPTAFSEPSLKLVADELPVPADQACGSITYPIKVATTDKSIVGRVDYHITDKNSLFVRYYYASFFLPPDTTNILTLETPDQAARYQTVTLGDTYLLSSRAVNSFHANVNRQAVKKGFDPGVETASQLGVGGNFYNPFPNWLVVQVTGDFNAKTGSDIPVNFNDTDFQFTDDMELTLGKHQVSFGGEFVHFRDISTSNIYDNGYFIFSGGVTGSAMADFLTGDYFTFEQSNIVHQGNKKNFYALYAQDSWQVNRKLTLNYGLRWEPFTAQQNAAGEGYSFNLADFEAGIQSKVFINAPAGLLFPGDRGGAGPGASYRGDWKHFEPRIGLSWDPRGKGREVIRASYGSFYDFESFQQQQNVPDSAPWADSILLSGGNFTNPWANFTYNGKTGVDPFPIAPSADLQFPTSGAYGAYSELHMKAPNVQQWSASAEKQFGQSWAITASYIGNHAVHNWLLGEENPGIYVPGNCTAGEYGLTAPGPCSTTGNVAARRLFRQLNPTAASSYGSLAEILDIGTSTYNGGVLSVQKRFSYNFSVVGNYTYSHCIDNGESGSVYAASGWLTMSQPQQIGNCSFDHRNQLTFNGVYRSPEFHSRVMNTILGHWQVAPIVTYLSGGWLTVTTGVDTALVGIATSVPNGGQPANRVPGQPVYVSHTILTGSVRGKKYFNPAAFAVPTATPGFTGNVINAGNGPITVGPLGDVRRGSLNGPSIHSFDLALTRAFKINERNEIDARFEAFNVLNLVNLNNPTTSMTSSTFGESIAGSASTPGYSSPQDPRIMQFALKWIF